MNRRAFVASAMALKLRAAERKSNLLSPSDTPDEHHLRIMWYNPVPPIDPAIVSIANQRLCREARRMVTGQLTQASP